MRVDQTLADLIARAAVSDPYRQVGPMPSDDYARWLDDRGIPLRWQTLHHLWQVGVLHPILVLEPALPPEVAGVDRFRPVDVGYKVATFIDLGMDVPSNTRLAPPDDVPGHLADCLLWHPFQLWGFHQLNWSLTLGVGIEVALAGPDAYAEIARPVAAAIRERIIAFGNSSTQHDFLRVLALLLAADPLVHPSVYAEVRVRPEARDDYFSWLGSTGGSALLSVAGLTVDKAKQWHSDLALAANIRDPLRELRVLIRHIDREWRDRLKGNALLAHSLYDAAEVLRRYLERYWNQELPEEDDVMVGPRHQEFKRAMYGTHRAADPDRRTLRRIARAYDIDPQSRATWFVEGETEEAFIRELAHLRHIDNLESAGVELMNMRGGDKLQNNELSWLLKRLQREEVFPYVTVDRDRLSDRLRVLRKCAADGLLSAGYTVWDPDFERRNFSLAELAEVANQVAATGGIHPRITPQKLWREMQSYEIPVGKAVMKLWKDAKFYLAGYAIECALKACIAKQTKRYDFPQRGDRLYTHNLEALVAVAGFKQALATEEKDDPQFAEYWTVVKDWNEGRRYEFPTASSARSLYNAVTDQEHGVLQWVMRRW